MHLGINHMNMASHPISIKSQSSACSMNGNVSIQNININQCRSSPTNLSRAHSHIPSNNINHNGLNTLKLNISNKSSSASPLTPSSSSSPSIPTIPTLPNLNVNYQCKSSTNSSPDTHHTHNVNVKPMDKPKRGRKKIDRTSYLNAKGI